MRTPNITMLHETLALCFDQVLSSLGETTKRVIYNILGREGIGREDLSSRFQDIEDLLVQFFGQGGRSVMIGTLARLCEQYSIPLNLAYADSLGNRMTQLKENILVQKLVPKQFRKDLETRMFEDRQGIYAPWSG